MQLLGGESFSDSSTSHFAAPKEELLKKDEFKDEGVTVKAQHT